MNGEQDGASKSFGATAMGFESIFTLIKRKCSASFFGGTLDKARNALSRRKREYLTDIPRNGDEPVTMPPAAGGKDFPRTLLNSYATVIFH